MKLSKKESLVVLTLALLGVIQLISWAFKGYSYLQSRQDIYYENRMSR